MEAENRTAAGTGLHFQHSGMTHLLRKHALKIRASSTNNLNQPAIYFHPQKYSLLYHLSMLYHLISILYHPFQGANLQRLDPEAFPTRNSSTQWSEETKDGTPPWCTTEAAHQAGLSCPLIVLTWLHCPGCSSRTSWTFFFLFSRGENMSGI